MKPNVKTLLRDERGKVLILALIVLVAGGLILGPLLGLMSTGLASGRVYETKTAELYAADAGLEDGINWLVHGRPYEWPWEAGEQERTWQRSQVLEINRSSVNVTIEALDALDDHRYKITSTAIGEGSGTTVISIVKAPPRNLGCHYFTEGLKLTNSDAPLEGTIIVLGLVELHNNVDMEAEEVFIDGDLILHNNSELHAEEIICVTGDITLQNNTLLKADIHLLGEHSTITIANADAHIEGNIWAEGHVTIAILSGNSNVSKPPEVWGHVYSRTGTITVRFGDPNARLKGNIYAYDAESLTIIRDKPNWGTHEGCVYHLNETGDWWVSSGDGCGSEEALPLCAEEEECDPEMGPPFTIAECPQLPDPQGTVVDTYEVLGYGG